MISLCMVVRNEADTISACLSEIKDHVQEIVLVDQSSTDRTVDIVSKYTDRIFIRPCSGTAQTDRQFSIDQAKYPWILVLDPDERLDEKLKNNLDQLIGSDFEAYCIPRKDIIDGRLFDEGLNDLQLRVFRKEIVKWPPFIHSYPTLYTKKVGRVNDGYLLHLRSLERIKAVHKERNTFVDSRTPKMHDAFVERVESWAEKAATQNNGGVSSDPTISGEKQQDLHNIHSVLRRMEQENEYMDREEALLRLMHELKVGKN